MRVKVYFNLKTHLWSIVALEGEKKNLVIDHQSTVTITNCSFKVSEASRQQVLIKKCRSVHAWIIGTLSDTTAPCADAVDFTYNPYRAATFTRRDNSEPIMNADTVWMIDRRSCARV
jgi:hypothetical protein